jgi:hypothetical protein
MVLVLQQLKIAEFEFSRGFGLDLDELAAPFTGYIRVASRGAFA